MIKAIIFDFDDTLIHSGHASVQAFRETGEELGLEIPTEKRILTMFGKPLANILEIFWPNADQKVLLDAYIKHYNKIPTHLVDNVREVLGTLKNAGFDLHIMSGNVNVIPHMKKANLSEDYFKSIFSPRNSEFHKPDGRVFNHFLEKYAKEEIVYVGDAINDVQASLDAGIAFIGMLNGQTTAEDLKRHGATQIVSNLKDLPLLFEKSNVSLPTEFGNFNVSNFKEHVVLHKGELTGDVLTRIHSECFTSEVLGSLRCDCKQQLHSSLRMIEKEGSGMVIYLKQEGRGIGLMNKLKAYGLQDAGMDTVEANHKLGFASDMRTYEDAVSILREFGVSSIRLLTNNPTKVEGVVSAGITVVRVSMEVSVNTHNRAYLDTKKEKMGHY